MSDTILRCCNNEPTLLVLYEIGSQFLVCQKCFSEKIWSRGTKKVEVLDVAN